MLRVVNHLRSNLVGYVALFVALGGTSYAAVSLPAGSVGNRQLKNHSVSAIKLDPGSIGGYVRYWAQINGNGALVASHPRAHLSQWETGSTPFGGFVGWMKPIPRGCFALATTVPNAANDLQSYASAFLQGLGDRKVSPFVGAYVYISAASTGVNVAVVCP